MGLGSWVLGGIALIVFGLVVLLDYRGVNAWYVRKVTRWETTDPKIVRFGGAAILLFAGVSLLWNDLFLPLGGLLSLGVGVAILTDPRGYGHQIVPGRHPTRRHQVGSVPADPDEPWAFWWRVVTALAAFIIGVTGIVLGVGDLT